VNSVLTNIRRIVSEINAINARRFRGDIEFDFSAKDEAELAPLAVELAKYLNDLTLISLIAETE
jgi:hypothetical protein